MISTRRIRGIAALRIWIEPMHWVLWPLVLDGYDRLTLQLLVLRFYVEFRYSGAP